MNAIEVRDLAVSYGQVDALHGVSFDVPQGTLVSLIGANGAGKTTLLKALMGALPARAGQVLLQGQPLGNTPVEARAARHVPGAGEALAVRLDEGGGQPAPGRLRLPPPHRFRARAGTRLRAVPGIGAAARAAGRHAVRRRAADGRHRPRPDRPSARAAAGRTVHRPGAADRAADHGRGGGPAPSRGPDRDPGRAERAHRASRAPTWPT